ncbi:hypothetical protein TorRG33x02_347560 [Trema orientale]|uniref:Uncharacterized protein n=1 Tax=Trema orientale TaxID=63057 RepID=A0A2P5ALF3_TREOI|nr:hypothetical protein TorRG33x02_347560 [Trema orientale]
MLQIKYIFKLGISPINIANDRSLEVYFELKKNEDKTKFSLCIDIIGEPITMFDSGMSVPANNYGVPFHEIRSHRLYIGGYYLEMPIHDEVNLDSVEIGGHDYVTYDECVCW